MNSNKLDLRMNILKFGLAAIGVILCLLIWNGPNGESAIADQVEYRDSLKVAGTFSYTGLLLFACAGVVVLFFIIQLITNTKRTVFSIIGILVALVIYLLFTMIGTSDTNATLALREDVQVSNGTINSTTAGLYTVIVGLVISVLAIVLGPVMGRMRK